MFYAVHFSVSIVVIERVKADFLLPSPNFRNVELSHSLSLLPLVCYLRVHQMLVFRN
jgi:hypothetical protein